MPNNFKLTGDYYVSKAGSDSNNGLTPDTPKRTLQGAISAISISSGQTKNIIVGAGVYREAISINAGYNFQAQLNFYADGNVIVEPPLTFSDFYIAAGAGYGGPSGRVYFYNFTIRNFNTITCFLSFGQGVIAFYNCNILNSTANISPIDGGYSNSNQVFNGCTLINSTINTTFFSTTMSTYTLNNCTFINCKILSTTGRGFLTVSNCYFNSSTIFSIASNISSFNFNNIQCPIITYFATAITTGIYQDIYGRYYDLSIATSTGDGTVGNPYGRPYTNGAAFSLTNHRILYPSYNVNSISSDPKFNNILKQDLSLRSDSPNLNKASNYIDNIGSTYLGTRIDASGSLFSGSNATVENLIFNFSDYIISGSSLSGSVTSAAIFVSSSAKVIQEIDYNGLLAFNKDTTAPTGSDVNVPDVLTYTSASNAAGANPDRLTYYMRWTTGSSQPVSDAQWENGGLWPAGSFNVFEWNTKPSVDYLGRGNGDQDFNIVNTPTFVKATWIQLRVTLRNDYLI